MASPGCRFIHFHSSLCLSFVVLVSSRAWVKQKTLLPSGKQGVEILCLVRSPAYPDSIHIRFGFLPAIRPGQAEVEHTTPA